MIRAAQPWLAAGVLLTLGLVPMYGQGPTVVADTYIQSGTSASQNFGALANILVGPGTGATQNRGLVQFDLSGLSGVSAPDVQKAIVWLYVNRVTTSGSVDVYDVATAWTEFGATWNSAPTQGILLGTIPTTTAGQWVGLDITTEVQGWLTTPGNNHGLALTANTVNSTTAVQFDSKESTTTSHPAQLQIVLHGPTGPSGPGGPQGATGAAGPDGASGVAGASGPSGPQGVQGFTGATGATGPSGVNGNTVLNGNGAPAIGLGVNGDYYVDNIGSCLYGPKASGSWPVVCTSLVGPAGPSGAAGPSGTAGPSGPSGASVTGSTGPTGVVGPSGPSGASVTGPSGPSVTGATGATGPSGVSITGASGPSGASGNVGFNGPSGPSGPAGAAGGIYNFGRTPVTGTIGFAINSTALCAGNPCPVNTLTYFPAACSLTVSAWSTVGGPTITIATGTPGNPFSNTGASCTLAVGPQNSPMTCTGFPLAMNAGTFADFGYTAGGAVSPGIFTFVKCQ